MTLRPALFDLWPSLPPEECEHVWDTQMYMVWGTAPHVDSTCHLCNYEFVTYDATVKPPRKGTPRAPQKTLAVCEKS